jgi:fructose-bisphosphate aldolase, class II
MSAALDLLPLLAEARAADRGVGAFNVVLLEHAEAIVAAAETAGLPAVLQISENCIGYHGSLEAVTSASLQLARSARVPVVVHLDHIRDVALVRRGLEAGVRSVMFDASELDYPQNVAATAEVVRLCHAVGAVVEAELGAVGGKDGVHAPGVRTDPAEAAAYVAATGVDSLAVAVGTSHAMTSRVASVDLDLIRALRAAVPVPLVLHGSSGLPDQQLRAAVAAGMTKINVSTHLNAVFTRAVRDILDGDPAVVDPRTYIRAGRASLATEAARLLTLIDGR